MIRRALAALMLLLTLAACAGDRAIVGTPGSSGPAGSAPATTTTEPGVIPDASVSSGTGKQASVSPTTKPEVSRSAEPPKGQSRKDWAPLTVTLSETCVEHGDELIVSATSDPFAGIGFAAGYSKPSDGAERVIPDYAYFDHESNPTGTIRWAFTIRPTIPYGPGVVKVVVNGEDGRGAFASLDIEVARSCA